jgi:hypothetical protein
MTGAPILNNNNDDATWSTTTKLTRRALIRGAVGAAGLPLLLSACVPGVPGAARPPSASGGGSARLQLPSYVPVQGSVPDFAGNADGLEPGYTNPPNSSSSP